VLTGWCANQYVSLIGWYQQHRELSELAAFLVLASYVVGLLPMLVFGGAWADRWGRKPFTQLALVASLAGSVLLMFGPLAEIWLHLGRVLTGVGMGLAMVAATSWIKELSLGTRGAVRAGLCTSAGFAVGPVISGVLVGLTASPELAYLVHAVTTLAWFVLVALQPERRPQAARGGALERTSAQNRKIFHRLVLPMAPWVFGLATSGFAVVTALTGQGQGATLLFSTVTVAVTMGMGALIQPVARRWSRPGSARLLVIGLATAMAALAVMIPVALTRSAVLGLVASILAGSANGILLLGGLAQVLNLAGPGETGKLTGQFYSVCYIGFLTPTLLALWRYLADPVWFVVLLLVLCALSLATVLRARKLLVQPRIHAVTTGEDGQRRVV